MIFFSLSLSKWYFELQFTVVLGIQNSNLTPLLFLTPMWLRGENWPLFESVPKAVKAVVAGPGNKDHPP